MDKIADSIDVSAEGIIALALPGATVSHLTPDEAREAAAALLKAADAADWISAPMRQRTMRQPDER